VSASGTHAGSAVAVELAATTPASWAAAVLADPLLLLVDHAHCELGAAASAQALIRRFPFDHELAERMGALAQEELAHFRVVLRVIDERGGRLLPTEPNPYVLGLDAAARRSRGTGPELLDRLLLSALVEARSCERFELLATAAASSSEHGDGDPALARLYADLAPSERGHMLLFPELARARFGASAVRARLAILQAAEAEVLARLPLCPRIHSGAPADSHTPP
jgi:tRNA-(ms[2]io[6]A)-hydroxylase